MDGISVETIFDAVVAEMRGADYDEATVGIYRRYFSQLSEVAPGGAYTHDVGVRFAQKRSGPRSKHYCRNVRVFRERIVRIADRFVETGTVDLSVTGRQCHTMPSSPGFQKLLEAWDFDMAERGLAQGTHNYYGRLAREYLLFLEANGTSSLEKADGSSILGFLVALKKTWVKTSTYAIVTNFRPFLRFTEREELVDAINMLNAKRAYGIVPMLDDGDEAAVISACRDRAVSARDAAITMLALTAGLRACDIIALRVSDVNWRDMTVSLIQKKTGNPLMVPMLPATASAIAEYLLEERPTATDAHLFLRSVAPYVPLADHSSIYAVTQKVFKAAGLDDCHAGTRLLRHNAASKMLRSGSPLPTISAVLGHADPDSTGIYMEVDTERMLACVLPLPMVASS